MRLAHAMGAGLAATGMFTAAAAQAAPAQADAGQTICPVVADQGSNLASAASSLTNATSSITGKSAPPPEMTKFFAQIALSAYCPAAVTSLSNGQLPPGINEVSGVLGGAGNGMLGGAGNGLLPGGLPTAGLPGAGPAGLPVALPGVPGQ